MGIELVLESNHHEPYLAMRVTCDGCNRLLDPKEAIVCWRYAANGNIQEQEILCISRCAGSSGSIKRLPVSRPIGQLEISK